MIGGPTGSSLDLTRLERLSEPKHEVLAELVRGCSPESSTRTTAVAALVLGLWQLRGRNMSRHVPSVIAINAGQTASDAIDDFVKTFVDTGRANRPGADGHRSGVPIRKRDAPGIMARAVKDRRKLGDFATDDKLNAGNARIYEEQYGEARKAAFGSGWSGSYDRAWTGPFGLLTDDDDEIILRLDGAPDRAAFRRDVLDDRRRLLAPRGIGRDLRPAPKSFSVSGSLTPDLWDGRLVRGVIELGLPVLFLSHTAMEPLNIANSPAIEVLPMLWRAAPVRPAGVQLMVPPMDWFELHAADVRRRLHLLPGPGTYEFAVLQVLHQLRDVCYQIARFAGDNDTATPEQITDLFWDLNARTFRGITLGVASLAWHGLGFDPGCPARKAEKALGDLRANGPMSRSDILRGAHLKKEQRDLLLERLAAEDLIRVEGRTVTATTIAEFVEALHRRPELPPAESFRARVAGRRGSA